MSSADTAWLLVSTALVLLMTPALGFFYAGMVRSKNALNTLMMSFSPLGFVGLAWALGGYAIAFGAAPFLQGVGLEAKGSIPHVLFMAYQGTFAIITAALISGAIVERMRFVPYLAFVTAWSLRSTRRSRSGCGAAAGSRAWARSTSPAALSCT